MNIQDHVLKQITYKLLKETLNDPEMIINEKLGKIAIDIVETNDEEHKEILINQYNSLKKLNELNVENINQNDLLFGSRVILNEKINQMVGTIINKNN